MDALDTAKKAADLLDCRDLAGLQKLMADGFTAKGPAQMLNKAQTLGYLQLFFTAFPDHHFNFTGFKLEGNLVHCSGQETGTHLGTFDLKPLGKPITLPPTGKTFSLPKSRFSFGMVDGMLTSFTEEPIKGGGLAGILEQLGVKLP